MATYIKNVSVKGLHRTDTYPGKDFELEFGPGVNVVYGLNGSGKTTLLHILANVCSLATDKFRHIDFDSVAIMNDKHNSVRIYKDDEKSSLHLPTDISHDIDIHIQRESVHAIIPDEATREMAVASRRDDRNRNIEIRRRLRGLSLLSVAYFPAYRSLSEILHLQHLLGGREGSPRWQRRLDDRLDDIFGRFTPKAAAMKSLSEIQDELIGEVRQSVADVARQNQEILSKLSFDILSTLVQRDEIRNKTRPLAEQLRETPMYEWLPEIATTYDHIEQRRGIEELSNETSELYTKALADILDQQTDRYAHIERFLKNVNQFLIGKELVIRPQQDGTNHPEVGIRREGDSELIGIETMSSGERQIFSLLHAASFLGEHDLVLIDEPEISLHIDWQYQFGAAISEILEDKQLIMCTHSPDMLAALENAGGNVIELDPRPVGPPKYLHEAEDIQR